MYGVLYAYTPEVFPAPNRGTGTGIASFFNRLAGLCAPIGELSSPCRFCMIPRNISSCNCGRSKTLPGRVSQIAFDPKRDLLTRESLSRGEIRRSESECTNLCFRLVDPCCLHRNVLFSHRDQGKAESLIDAFCVARGVLRDWVVQIML